MEYVNVVVPGPWWNALTYAAERPLPEGARVRVPLGNGERVGFVSGRPTFDEPPRGLRCVGELLDEGNVLGEELWDLSRWMGKNFFCGRGLALQAMCPRPLLGGESLATATVVKGVGVFSERMFFSPWDEERLDFYRRMLARGGRTLVLFSEAASAKAFFNGLSPEEKAEAVLWPSTGGKKLWEVWQKVRAGEVRVVVAPPGGVFAPLPFDRILVEDEANPGYVSQRAPRISARTLAGRRAVVLGAELILGGRMPSSKTFLRRPSDCLELPERASLVLVDMKRSVKPDFPGIEGQLPLTVSLLERTRATLEAGRDVFWILDRRGEAGEVACSACGRSISCPRCASIMRSENRGTELRCVRCGHRAPLPSVCPSCRGRLLVGRRPGLDALALAAARFIKAYPLRILSEGCEKGTPEKNVLTLGTRQLLARGDSSDVGLVAWLDLDTELCKMDYSARFQAFSMVWESYWRGLKKGDGAERVVLVQTRRPGGAWQKTLRQGWGRFWKGELEVRRGLNIPPFAHWVQIDLPEGEDREAFLSILEDAGLFVMDPGGLEDPLWVTLDPKGSETLRGLLGPRFEIRCSRRGFPVVTVWTE